MQISPDGIALRDEKVFRFAREKNIPIVMLTSGSPSPYHIWAMMCVQGNYITKTPFLSWKIK